MHVCQGVIDSKVRLCDGLGERKKLNHSWQPAVLFLRLVFYRTFFWWESDSISKAWKFIWVNWLYFTSILIFHRFSCFRIEVLGCENIAKYKFKTQGFLRLYFMIFVIYYRGSERAAHRFSTEQLFRNISQKFAENTTPGTSF